MQNFLLLMALLVIILVSMALEDGAPEVNDLPVSQVLADEIGQETISKALSLGTEY